MNLSHRQRKTHCLHQQTRMFIFIWATLLFSVRSINADTGTVPEGRQDCKDKYCITLSERAIVAVVGLCVVIPCSFTTSAEFKVTGILWYKCDPPKTTHERFDALIFDSSKNTNVEPGFRGRVSMLEPDLSLKNCSIIINSLQKSDSGLYQLRVVGYNNKKADGLTFGFKASINVTDLSQKPTVVIPPLTEGPQATLTCTAPGLCSGSVPEITWMCRGAEKCRKSCIHGNITDFKTETLTAVTQRHSSTLTFIPSAKHHDTEVTCKVSFTGSGTTEETVTLKVAYIKITGKVSLKEGDVLILVCRADSFSPSLIAWTQLGSNKNLPNRIKADQQNSEGADTLVLPNMMTEHAGQYVCTAKHLNITLTADVHVTFLPKILNSSGCEVQSEVLICMCISQGIPLPTITWRLLKNYTDYSVITTVSNHTVNSTVILTVKDHSTTVVECVGSSGNEEVQHNLTIITSDRQEADHHGPSAELILTTAVAVCLIVNVFLIIFLIFLWNSRNKLKLNRKEESSVYENISQRLN